MIPWTSCLVQCCSLRSAASLAAQLDLFWYPILDVKDMYQSVCELVQVVSMALLARAACCEQLRLKRRTWQS